MTREDSKTMDELDDDDSGTSFTCSKNDNLLPVNTARQIRNLAEKQRRDNLNEQIVQMQKKIGEDGKKTDKINTLRKTTAVLKMCYAFGKGVDETNAVQKYSHKEQFIRNWATNAAIGSNGFFIVLTSTGSIVFVSHHVEEHLGYNAKDLLAQSIFDSLHPDDFDKMEKFLSIDECLVSPGEPDNDGDDSLANQIALPTYQKFKYFRNRSKTVYCRLATSTNSRKESRRYEYFVINGIMRLAQTCRIRESQGEIWNPETRSKNDVIIVSTAMLIKNRWKIEDMARLDSNKDEYVTRHLVDGRIIYCDPRISTVAGYFSYEVSGFSAFKFMHRDDVKWTIVALKEMYNTSKNFGKSCYRLLTKTGDFIYLRTHGYLELYRSSTENCLSFVCINTLVSEAEGKQLIAEMKSQYSAEFEGSPRAIQGSEDGFESEGSDLTIHNYEDSNVEDPMILEEAITDLISDLPSPTLNENLDLNEQSIEPEYKKAVEVSKQMPSAVIQAKRIGIDNPEIYLSKSAKRKQSPLEKKNDDESVSECTSRNDRRPATATQKGKSKFDKPKSPLHNTYETFCDSIAEARNKREVSIESCGTSSRVMSNVAHTPNNHVDGDSKANLKRSLDDVKELDTIPIKRKIADERETLELINIDYPTYIQIHDVNGVKVESSANDFIDIDQQLLSTTIENDSDIVQLFTNHPSSMNFEGTSKEENIHQYDEMRNHVNTK